MVCSHKFVLEVFGLLEGTVDFSGVSYDLAWLFHFIDLKFFLFLLGNIFLDMFDVVLKLFVLNEFFLYLDDVGFLQGRNDESLDKFQDHRVIVIALLRWKHLKILAQLLLLIIIQDGLGNGLYFGLDFLIKGLDSLIHEFEEYFFDLFLYRWDHNDLFNDWYSVSLLRCRCSLQKSRVWWIWLAKFGAGSPIGNLRTGHLE